MLCLTRNVGERIFINDSEIIITICAIKGNQVRLGVSAPKDITIHREEIWDAIQEEKTEGNK